MFGSLIPERSGEANCVPCGVLAQAIKSTYASTLDDTWTNSAYMTNISAEFTSRGFTLPGGIDDVADILALCSLTAQNPESTGEVDMVWDDDADRKRTICPDGSLSFTNDYDQYNYRFGFNGKERDDEMKGEGNSLDFGARIYDPRIGRWLSTDPLQAKYENLSPYNFTANSPILFVDSDGKIIRDPDGNIVFVPVGPVQRSHSGRPGKTYKLTAGYIFADDGTRILVYKNENVKDKAWDTDCHGQTFTNGKYWIDNDQVPTLLQHDGYQEVDLDQRKEGDAIIYTSNNNLVEDSRTLTKDKDVVFGQGGLEESNYESNIYKTWDSPNGKTKIRAFRKTSVDITISQSEITDLTNRTLSEHSESDLNTQLGRTAHLPERIKAEKESRPYRKAPLTNKTPSPSQGNDLHEP